MGKRRLKVLIGITLFSGVAGISLFFYAYFIDNSQIGILAGAMLAIVGVIGTMGTLVTLNKNKEKSETIREYGNVDYSGNYKVIVSRANIYDYYGRNRKNAYFDRIPEGFFYPKGTRLFIYDEFEGYGRIIYPNKDGEDVRGYIQMTDLKKD